jgi:glycosyltransferase involved in cell wall biosynthesis
VKRSSVLVVATPSPLTGGGGLRALRSLKAYARFFETSLFIPWGLWSDKKLLRESVSYLRELKNSGIEFAGYSSLPTSMYKLSGVAGLKAVLENMVLLAPNAVRLKVNKGRYDAVIVLHENWDAVYAGAVLAELLGAKNAVLLQLPPFYGSRKRFSNIVKALRLWRGLMSNTPIEKALFEYEALVRCSVAEHLRRLRYGDALRKYTLVLGVSRAVAVEMGPNWLGRVFCLDPGVSLEEEDLRIVSSVREGIKEKGNYVVFGGRFVAEKGNAEALLVFKAISKRFPGLKLVVTGRVNPRLYSRALRICKKLGIEGKVVFTGYVPREERFEIIARAKLMLYPSHVDSFPYAILESLHLGTPVVAYRIPAIEIYYGGLPGVELVQEWDLEALTVKAIDILERGVDAVEPPKIKSWEEIMSEEVSLVNKLVEEGA